MNIDEIRTILSDHQSCEDNAFEVLKAITELSNSKATQNTARELVIRALAIRSAFGEGYAVLLDQLVRVVGLMPYADSSLVLSLEDQLEVEAHRAPLADGSLIFHTLQLQIFKDLVAGRNVVLSATTSVGKSLIVDAVIGSKAHKAVAIIVPTIALIDETRRRLFANFGTSHDIITHPSQTPDFKRPTIFVLTQERALTRPDIERVEFFVIDEFYKLDLRSGDQDRSIDLNLCFHRLASQGAQFYLIGPHINAVNGLASKYRHVFVPSEFSTVALDIEKLTLPKNGDERKKQLVDLCNRLDEATLIYCQSPGMASQVAEHLIQDGFSRKCTGISDAVEWLKEEYPEEWVLTRALECGIGIHHGNVPRAIQQFMVRAFDAGLITYLICTSTIIEGVNTVAKNVIIYDRRIGISTIDHFTFRNISGRAGRMNKHFIGRVFILETPPEVDEFEVDLPINQQDEDTPLALIIDLPVEDLAPISKTRLDALQFDSPVSMDTLRLNRHVPFDGQAAIFREISRDLLLLEDALVWSGMPKPHQLLKVCELIYRHLDDNSLVRYGITSGVGLKAELDRLRTSGRYRDYIEHRVERRLPSHSISEAVEQALRFMRRYVGYTFPRHLMAISNIQAEAMHKGGRTVVGDYSFFAARAESLFIDAGLFALDEYGVPPETARRLGRRGGPAQTLDEALQIVRQVDLGEDSDLHPFEVDLLRDVRRTLPPRRSN